MSHLIHTKANAGESYRLNEHPCASISFDRNGYVASESEIYGAYQPFRHACALFRFVCLNHHSVPSLLCSYTESEPKWSSEVNGDLIHRFSAAVCKRQLQAWCSFVMVTSTSVITPDTVNRFRRRPPLASVWYNIVYSRLA